MEMVINGMHVQKYSVQPTLMRILVTADLFACTGCEFKSDFFLPKFIGNFINK